MADRLRALLDRPLDPSARGRSWPSLGAILLGLATLFVLAGSEPGRPAPAQARPAASSTRPGEPGRAGRGRSGRAPPVDPAPSGPPGREGQRRRPARGSRSAIASGAPARPVPGRRGGGRPGRGAGRPGGPARQRSYRRGGATGMASVPAPLPRLGAGLRPGLQGGSSTQRNEGRGVNVGSLFSRASADSTSASSAPGCGSTGRSSSTPTAGRSSPGTSPKPSDSRTSARSASETSTRSTSSAAASPARTSARRQRSRDRRRPLGSLGRVRPDRSRASTPLRRRGERARPPHREREALGARADRSSSRRPGRSTV